MPELLLATFETRNDVAAVAQPKRFSAQVSAEGNVAGNDFAMTHLVFEAGGQTVKFAATATIPGIAGAPSLVAVARDGAERSITVSIDVPAGNLRDHLTAIGFLGLPLDVTITRLELTLFLPGAGGQFTPARPFLTLAACFELNSMFSSKTGDPQNPDVQEVTASAEFCLRLGVPYPPALDLPGMGLLLARFELPSASITTGWRVLTGFVPPLPDLPDLTDFDFPDIDLSFAVPAAWIADLCKVERPSWLALPDWQIDVPGVEWLNLAVDLPGVSLRPETNEFKLEKVVDGNGKYRVTINLADFVLRIGEDADNAIQLGELLTIKAALDDEGKYQLVVHSGYTEIRNRDFALPFGLLKFSTKGLGIWAIYRDQNAGDACFGLVLEIKGLKIESTAFNKVFLEGDLRLTVLGGAVISHSSQTPQWRLENAPDHAELREKHSYFVPKEPGAPGTDYGLEIIDGDVTEGGRLRLIWKEKAPWRWVKALGKDIFGTSLPPLDGNETPRFCALDIFKVDTPDGERVFQARFDWADQPPVQNVPPAVTPPQQANGLVCISDAQAIQYPVVVQTPANDAQTTHAVDTSSAGMEALIDLPGVQLLMQPPAFHTLLVSQQGGDDPALSYIVTFDAPKPGNQPLPPLMQAALGFSRQSGGARETLGGSTGEGSQEPFASLGIAHLTEGRTSVQAAGYAPDRGLTLFQGRPEGPLPTLLRDVTPPVDSDDPQCPVVVPLPPARAVLTDSFSDLRLGRSAWAARLALPGFEKLFSLFSTPEGGGPVSFEIERVCIDPDKTSEVIVEAALTIDLLGFNVQGEGKLILDLSTGAVRSELTESLALLEPVSPAPAWAKAKVIPQEGNVTYLYSEPVKVLGQEFIFRKKHTGGGSAPQKTQFLELDLADGQVQLSMVEGVEAFLAINDFAEAPILFGLRDVSLGTEGVTFDTTLLSKQVKFSGLNSPFHFERAFVSVTNGRLDAFELDGNTTLPKDVLGGGEVGVSVVGGMQNGKLVVESGGASIKGDLLKIKSRSMRFDFELTEVGLFFRRRPSGSPQFYFEITGKGTFAPGTGEFNSGLLQYLKDATITFDEMRLTDDFIEGLELRVALKKPISFDVFGLFRMEIRSLGIAPRFEEFGTPALMIGGKVEFSLGEDVLDADISFHTLYIGPARPGEFLPRTSFKGLRVEIATGDGFRIAGMVSAMDTDDIKGFGGEGLLEMPGFPGISAAFTFARIRTGDVWRHSWFIAIGLNKVSFGLQPIPLHLRAIRAGFGHRFQLKLLEVVDETDDVRTLIDRLIEAIAASPGLDRLESWSPDFANRARGRNMVALEADLTMATANTTPLEYQAAAERKLGNITARAQFIFRDDGTFIATFKGYLFAPYDYIVNNDERAAQRPSLAGFALVSAKKEMFLFHARSLKGAYMGPPNLPVPDAVKKPLQVVEYDATLLYTPDVLHAELGWPDRLFWGMDLGPLKISARGGVLFRIEDGNIIFGTNFVAKGSLALSGGISLGFIGVRVEALASVTYGQQLLALMDTRRPLDSKVYAAVGIDIRVSFRISAWLRIKLGFVRVTWRISFSFDIQITASVAFGAAGRMDLGMRARAHVSIGVFGRRLGVRISVGIRDGAVDRARAALAPYMKSILEPDKPVPTIPGLEPRLERSNPAATALPLEVAAFHRAAPGAVAPHTSVAALIEDLPERPPAWEDLTLSYAAADANQGRDTDKVWLVWVMPSATRFLPILDPNVEGPQFEMLLPHSGAEVFHLKPNGEAGPIWSPVTNGQPFTPYVNPNATQTAEEVNGDQRQATALKLYQMIAGCFVPKDDQPAETLFPFNLDGLNKEQIEALVNFEKNPDEQLGSCPFEEDWRRKTNAPLAPHATLDPDDPYDRALQESVQDDAAFDDESNAQSWKELYVEQARSTRSLLTQEFAGAQRDWAERVQAQDVDKDAPAWKDGPLPLLFETGLVLAVKGEALPEWISDPSRHALQIGPVGGTRHPVPAELRFGDWNFEKHSPELHDIATYYDEDVVAVRWKLVPTQTYDREIEPEAMLRHYEVEIVERDGETVRKTINCGATATRSQKDGETVLLRARAQFTIPTEEVRRLLTPGANSQPPNFLLNVTPVAQTGERGTPTTIRMTFKARLQPLAPQDPKVALSLDTNSEGTALLSWVEAPLPETGQATKAQDWELILRGIPATAPSRFPEAQEPEEAETLPLAPEADLRPGDLVLNLRGLPIVEEGRKRALSLDGLAGPGKEAAFIKDHIRDHNGNALERDTRLHQLATGFLRRDGVTKDMGRKWLFRLRALDANENSGVAVQCPVFFVSLSPETPENAQNGFRPEIRRVIPSFEWPGRAEVEKIAAVETNIGQLHVPVGITADRVDFARAAGNALFAETSFTLPADPAHYEGIYIEQQKFFAQTNVDDDAGFRKGPLTLLKASADARMLPDSMAHTMDWAAHYPTSDDQIDMRPDQREGQGARPRYFRVRQDHETELLLHWPPAMRDPVTEDGIDPATVLRGDAVRGMEGAQARYLLGRTALPPGSHPLLCLILGALSDPNRADGPLRAQVLPAAVDTNAEPDLWMGVQSNERDPYGWAVLAQLGLGATLRLRRKWSGRLLAPDAALLAIRVAHSAAMADLLLLDADAHGKLHPFNLTAEMPLLRASAFKSNDADAPLSDAALFMLQIGLRPMAQPLGTTDPKVAFLGNFQALLAGRFTPPKAKPDQVQQTPVPLFPDLDFSLYSRWTRRFFFHGHRDDQTPGQTVPVPCWLTSPQNTALVPTLANRVTVIEPMPDLWATQVRYRLRLRGRYAAALEAAGQEPIAPKWTYGPTRALPRRVPVAPIEVLGARVQYGPGLRASHHILRKVHQDETLDAAGQRTRYAVQAGAAWLSLTPSFAYAETWLDHLGVGPMPEPIATTLLPAPDGPAPLPLDDPLSEFPLAAYGATEIAAFAPPFYTRLDARLVATAGGLSSTPVNLPLPGISPIAGPTPADPDQTTNFARRDTDWATWGLEAMATQAADWADKVTSTVRSVQLTVRFPRLFESLPLESRAQGAYFYAETQPVDLAEDLHNPAGRLPDLDARLDLVLEATTARVVLATLRATRIPEKGAQTPAPELPETLFEIAPMQPDLRIQMAPISPEDFAGLNWGDGLVMRPKLLPSARLTASGTARARLKTVLTFAGSPLAALDALALMETLLRFEAHDDVPLAHHGLPKLEREPLRHALAKTLAPTHLEAAADVTQALEARWAHKGALAIDIPKSGLEGAEIYVEGQAGWEIKDGPHAAQTEVVMICKETNAPFASAFDASVSAALRQAAADAHAITDQIFDAPGIAPFLPSTTQPVRWTALRGLTPPSLWGELSDD